MQVDLYGSVQFLGQHRHSGKGAFTHHIGRVWSEADVDAIVIAVLIAQRETAVDAGFSVSRPRGLDIDHREGQQCAQTATINRFGSDLREKILIGQRRGPAHQ